MQPTTPPYGPFTNIYDLADVPSFTTAYRQATHCVIFLAPERKTLIKIVEVSEVASQQPAEEFSQVGSCWELNFPTTAPETCHANQEDLR
jgi:hypothetical protein